jgi:DNA-binding CsgD family transcriptional regulator/tetratricopeptide (TPR) repeat protein
MRAVALAEEQLRSLPLGAADSDRGRLLLALATAALPTMDTQMDLLAVTKEAVGLLSTEAPAPLEARALALYARVNSAYGRVQDAARFAGEALEMARRLGLRDVALDAKTTLAHLQRKSGTGEPDVIEAALTQAVEESAAAGEVAAQLRGLASLAGMYLELGRLEDAKARLAETCQVARQAGRRWSPDAIYARAELAFAAFVTGDWDLVSTTTETTGEAPPELARAVMESVGLEVAVARNRDDTLEYAKRVRESWDVDGYVIVSSAGALIELAARTEGLEAATQVHDEAVRRLGELWDEPYFMGRLRLDATLLAELASNAANASLAERRQLQVQGDELDAATTSVLAAPQDMMGRRIGPEGRAWEMRARAEYARVRWACGIDPPPEDELVELWRECVARFDSFGHPYEAARSRVRLAEILHAAGRTAEAANELGSADSAAEALGAEMVRREVRLLAALAIPEWEPAPVGRVVATVAGEPGRVPTGALTRRELEVLSLVAEGWSNGEIAQRLFISRKTVSVHVSNILAKLNAQGRTEAAAVARRLGILT